MEVRVKNLTKQFGKTTAVDHINVVFQDGKLTGLLGPSGCGKSTTLHMIAGLESVTDGEIMFGDRDVTTLMPEKRNIGLMFQNYALYPHMTVRDNITFPLSNMKDPETGKTYSRAKRNAAADEIAKLVQIDSLLDRKPGQFSENPGCRRRFCYECAVRYWQIIWPRMGMHFWISSSLEVEKFSRIVFLPLPSGEKNPPGT